MKNTVRSVLVVVWAVVSALVVGAGAVNQLQEVRPAATAYVITCGGLIDDGLYKSLQRRTEEAIEAGADYIIYQIETYGGFLKSADDIRKYFQETGRKVHTTAYIKTEAISAGALISVYCRDIIMRSGSLIGDCAPVQMGGQIEGVEREKVESVVRSMFEHAAEANRYPKALLRAMVTMQIEVYRIKNKTTGRYEFFEGDELPADANVYDLANKELIDSDKELLTLTASKAYEYGIARAVVEDIDGVLAYLADRDGVEFSRPCEVLRPNWSEKMVRWLNHPAVMSVLIMLALLGVYMELSTPGVGLPGLVAVICFAIVIGSKYLVGMANWVEVALLVVGVVLLMIEFFVLPGFGIAGVLGIVFLLGGIFGMLVRNPPNRLPWPETAFDWEVFVYNALGLCIGFVGFVVLAWLVARYLPHIEFLSGLILAPAAAKTGGELEVSASAPAQQDNVQLRPGDRGQVLTPLRPAGRVRFGQVVVDCVAEGQFIEKDRSVEIIRIRGNRVVVTELNASGER